MSFVQSAALRCFVQSRSGEAVKRSGSCRGVLRSLPGLRGGLGSSFEAKKGIKKAVLRMSLEECGAILCSTKVRRSAIAALLAEPLAEKNDDLAVAAVSQDVRMHSKTWQSVSPFTGTVKLSLLKVFLKASSCTHSQAL